LRDVAPARHRPGPRQGDPFTARGLSSHLHVVFEDLFDLALAKLPQQDVCLLDVSGPGAGALAAAAAGTLLVCGEQEQLSLIQVQPLTLDETVAGLGCAAEIRRLEQAWLDELERGQADFADNPFPLGPVWMIVDRDGGFFNLRTRNQHSRHDMGAWKEILLAALPHFDV
jgi:hypothetical protein